MSYIKIFDTTLRDGEQSPGFSMTIMEKLQMAKQLEKLKVDVIEAGFPIASPDDFEAVKQIAMQSNYSEICGLARSLEKDIVAAYEAVKYAKKPRIHTFIATSPIHMQYKLKKTHSQVLKMAVAAVKLCKSLCDRVDFSPEDALRSEHAFLFEIIEAAIEAGADTINIPDTVGYSTPEEYGSLIKAIKLNVPNIEGVIIATHCHNDLGMAVANSLAGIENGATQIECTINGIGERAGNAALEEAVMALKTRENFYQCTMGVDTTQIYSASKLLTSITGIPVQPNKAIVGANAFAHESGIHQDGVIKEKSTYEIINPETIGVVQNKIVLGKHSGRNALKTRLETLGFEVGGDQLNDLFKEFKTIADKKQEIYDEDLILMMNRDHMVEEFYMLKDIEIFSSFKGAPAAVVIIIDKNGNEFKETASGNGPIDSGYQAINKVMRLDDPKLLDFTVNAVTEGIDAQATVAVRVDVNGQTFSASESDTDIVIASCKAYVRCLNRALIMQKHEKMVTPTTP